MQKFRVNQYIELKLVDQKTKIYINGVFFRQCKFLLLNIPVEKINYLDDIKSIDEASERLDESMEIFKHSIDLPFEMEFWGHCSNLQAWAENEYDSQLLHKNLAFPLLETLREHDPVAKKVFKSEIAKRFLSGNLSVMLYIIKEEYLNHFNNEELKFLLKDFNFNKLKALKGIKSLELFQKLTEIGNLTARRFLKEEILECLKNGEDETLIFIFKNNYLNYFTKNELYSIYKDTISKFKSSKLLLLFLKSLLLQNISDIEYNYKDLIKKKLIATEFKDRDEIFEFCFYLDILEKHDLIDIIRQFKSFYVKKSEIFQVLDILIPELQFNFNFSIYELMNILLVENEKTTFLDIYNSSDFPWSSLDFQADTIRRRTWQGELYFDILDGHVNSIELYYDSSNSKSFFDNLKNLKKFKKLNNLNLLIFSDYSDEMYNLIKDNLFRAKRDFGLNELNNIVIYDVSEKSFYLNRIMV